MANTTTFTEVDAEKIRKADLAKTITDGIARKVAELIENGKIPADWDGHEIRQFIADYAAEMNFIKMPTTRKRNYINTRRVNCF